MRTRHKTAWDVELAIARGELEKLGQELPAPTRPHVRAGIRQATAMVAAGLSQDEIAAALNVPATTIHSWRTDHRKLWDEELARAMETALVLVRSQAGTDKVEEDPATYICRARLCERWARENGRELFPAGEDPTLSSFYATYYLPVRLSDAAEPTKKLYRGTVRLWSLITGDPPLKTIGPELLSRFKNCLERMRGLKPIARMSVNTVRKHLCHLQVLLDKSGPPGFKNRDAAGIIPGPVPWIKPPRGARQVAAVRPHATDRGHLQGRGLHGGPAHRGH